jgi:hypothetical protein
MVDPDEFTILKQDNAKLRAENVALLVPVSRWVFLCRQLGRRSVASRTIPIEPLPRPETAHGIGASFRHFVSK